MKYRAKPITIEALRFDGTRESAQKIRDELGILNAYYQESGGVEFTIVSTDSEMVARKGDFIIRAVDGSFYPCPAALFAASYERIE